MENSKDYFELSIGNSTCLKGHHTCAQGLFMREGIIKSKAAFQCFEHILEILDDNVQLAHVVYYGLRLLQRGLRRSYVYF